MHLKVMEVPMSSDLNPVDQDRTGAHLHPLLQDAQCYLRLAHFPVTTVCVWHLADLLHHLTGLHGAHDTHDLLTRFLIYVTASAT